MGCIDRTVEKKAPRLGVGPSMLNLVSEHVVIPGPEPHRRRPLRLSLCLALPDGPLLQHLVYTLAHAILDCHQPRLGILLCGFPVPVVLVDLVNCGPTILDPPLDLVVSSPDRQDNAQSDAEPP